MATPGADLRYVAVNMTSSETVISRPCPNRLTDTGHPAQWGHRNDHGICIYMYHARSAGGTVHLRELRVAHCILRVGWVATADRCSAGAHDAGVSPERGAASWADHCDDGAVAGALLAVRLCGVDVRCVQHVLDGGGADAGRPLSAWSTRDRVVRAGWGRWRAGSAVDAAAVRAGREVTATLGAKVVMTASIIGCLDRRMVGAIMIDASARSNVVDSRRIVCGSAPGG
jgi:hypothetical protein